MAVRFILVVLAVAIFHFMLQLITILNRATVFRDSFTSRPASVPITRALRSPCVPQRFGGGLLALPSACPRIRSTRRAPFRVYSFLGISGLSALLDAACRLPPLQAIVVEEVPWGEGKRTLTRAYMLFLARWARRLSWKETAEAFRTSWEKVFDAVEHVVTSGWNTGRSARSTLSGSTKSSTPKATSI